MTEQAIKDIFADFKTMPIEDQIKIFKRLCIIKEVKNLMIIAPEYSLWVKENRKILLCGDDISNNSTLSDKEVEAYVTLYMLM